MDNRPIDGTKAFILGQPTWSNLVGLYYKKPVLTLANFPVLGKCYYADEKGAYLLVNNKLKRIRSNSIKKLKMQK